LTYSTPVTTAASYSSNYRSPVPKSSLSENTLNVALRALGYGSDQMTAHGFRSTASTLLNEQGFNRDWIERQLAHGERDKVRGSYNYAEYLADRRRMMQAWADYLDELRTRVRLKAA
jgi:integrase